MIPEVTARHSDTEDFARYEFKYVVTEHQRHEIESEIRHFMSYDGHVHEELENSYFVRSLYFDDDAAHHYYEKIDGTRSRRKFRIRTYATTFADGLPIYLELKGRHIDRTYKQRISIAYADIGIFADGDDPDAVNERYAGKWLAERFLFEFFRRQLKPKVLVDYIRRPYVSTFDLNFRVTFDSKLSALPAKTLFPPDAARGVNCLAGYTILEVKFHRRIPVWFHRLLQNYNLRRVSVSKFCVGMEACGLAVNLS